MKRIAIAALALAIGAVAATAQQSDVIKQRKDEMKRVGAATGGVVKMLKGEEPFDLAKAQEALKVYEKASSGYVVFFPDSAKTGGETNALASIWENKSDFEARLTAWNADSRKASAEIVNEATFKKIMPAVLKNCGSCHEIYRAKQG